MVSHQTRVVILLILALIGFLPAASQESGDGDGDGVLTFLRPALNSIKADEILQNVKVLASDKFEGRNVGTAGEALTVNYLVDQFKRAGLEPGNPDGTYVQKVPLIGFRTKPQIEFSINGEKFPLQFPDDFIHEFPRLQPNVTVKNSGIVFAGYGIVAPEYDWDDYKAIDVRNKLVILLGGEPSIHDKNDPKKLDAGFFKGDLRTFYSTMEFKKELALKKGAAAVLCITDPEKSPNYSIFKTFALLEGFALRPQGPANKALAITGLITIGASRKLLAASGQDFEALQKSAQSKDFKPVLTSAKANISVTNKLRRVESQNVVARIDGSDPRLKNEYVIYTAHWDHLGRDKDLKGDQIYNGAIDNAIGTAQLLAVAKGFAMLPKKPKRSILFIAVTAEEKGFLGSRYYAQHPLFPIARTAANINLDGGNAWGRTKDIMQSNYGLSTLDETFDEAARMQGRVFLNESLGDGGYYFGSDQIEFAKVGIPAAFPFSGFNYPGKATDFGEKMWNAYGDKDYHKVSDEVGSNWDLSGAAEDAQLFLIAGYNVAQVLKRPEWKAGSEFRRQ